MNASTASHQPLHSQPQRQTACASPLEIECHRNVPMPMRDGTILRADIYRPAATLSGPALLVRTPYDKDQPAPHVRFARAGYAVIVQDMRGRFASDGDHIPFYGDLTQEGEDGYDSVEWIAAQPWCNGQVGTMGESYKALAQWLLAITRPPHLKAMCARSIPPELRDIDYTGAFRPGRRVHWLMVNMAPDLRRRQGGPPPHHPSEARPVWNDIERARWLNLLPWSQLPRHLPEPFATAFRNWTHDPAASTWNLCDAYREIEVPNLDISGWFDHCNATLKHLAGMQQHGRTQTARQQSRVVIGPWNHITFGFRKVGALDSGPAAEVDCVDIQIRWFDHWLKGVDNGVDRDPTVSYFVMGAAQWRAAPSWPPPAAGAQVFYLRQAGQLDAQPPVDDEPEDSYTYDPHDPVPTLWSPDLFTEPADRSLLDHRRDILRYRTAPLGEALEIIGEPEVVLHAASSAVDTDFFARLVEEAPGGPAMELCAGMVRARHRHGLDHQDLLTPHAITEYHIHLGPVACRIPVGHRLRLEITSSDFPDHDRNHNTGKNDLRDAELATAHQRITHTAAHPSRIVLPTTA